MGELMETFNETIIIVYYPMVTVLAAAKIAGTIAVVVICPVISLCHIVVYVLWLYIYSSYIIIAPMTNVYIENASAAKELTVAVCGTIFGVIYGGCFGSVYGAYVLIFVAVMHMEYMYAVIFDAVYSGILIVVSGGICIVVYGIFVDV